MSIALDSVELRWYAMGFARGASGQDTSAAPATKRHAVHWQAGHAAGASCRAIMLGAYRAHLVDPDEKRWLERALQLRIDLEKL